MGKAFTNYAVEDRSYVSYIKREIHLEVARARFSDRKAGEIDIIVSELCSNLIKHAVSGEIMFRVSQRSPENPVVELICVDKGPGITDLPKMMKDGTSTSGTLGQGLGAINRLSTFCQIYSLPGAGTIVYTLVSNEEDKFTRTPHPDLQVRAVCLNKPREIVCGDGYRVKSSGEEIAIFFGDGLGHGEQAKAAVDTAGDFFLECRESSPSQILVQMHESLRRTRGLVGAVAVFNKIEMSWKICGIGNIAIRMYNGILYKNYMSYNGTVGLNIPKTTKDSVFPIEKNQHLVMCSDGVRSRWDINGYPSILKYDNTILASALYRDFTRGNDDCSVLVAKVI